MSRSLFQCLCFLAFALVDSSCSNFLSVTYTVGQQAILPCSWKSRLRALSSCHIQWQNSASATVFEQLGEHRWQAQEYRGRVEVPEERLGSGDCSLVISDVQLGDTGQYESFMVVDGEGSRKTRMFIQGVKLSVFDHKSHQARGLGDDLVLDLHSCLSVRVIFQGRNSSEWVELWNRAEENSPGLEKDPLKEQLIVKNLQRSHEGMYKVLDEHSRAISTVQLAVQGSSTRVHDTMENKMSGDAVRISCSLLPLCLALVTSCLIPRLLV